MTARSWPPSSAWRRRCTSTRSAKESRPSANSTFCARSAARECRATISADQCPATTSPHYSRPTKDRVPREHVVGVEPPLDLPPVAEVKNADHPRADRDLRTGCAHLAQRAHMRVVAEHVVLAQPEPKCAELAEEVDQRSAPPKITGKRMRARDVPHDIVVDKGFDRGQITGAKGCRRLPIRGGVSMLGRRLTQLLTTTSTRWNSFRSE